jgi:hypothetical protein
LEPSNVSTGIREKIGQSVAALLLLAAAGLAQGRDALIEKNRLLGAELELAKSPSVYLYINTGARTAELRIRGMSLKKWELAGVRMWGRRLCIETVKLKKITGWTAQERINLTPGKEPEKDDKPRDIGDDVLEITDMPSRYSFIMDGEVKISIQPRASGFFGRVGSAWTGLFRSISLPLKTLWNFIRKKKFTVILIKTETKKDAQEIFWSIPEASKILIHNIKN